MALSNSLRLCISRVLRSHFSDYFNKVPAVCSRRVLSSDATSPPDTVTVDDMQRETRGRDIDNPVMVASTTNRCIVGCSCSEEHPTLKWFFLDEGPVQTCDCGFYFKLDLVHEEHWIPEHARIMTVDKARPDPRMPRKGMPFSYPVKQKMDKVS